MLPAFHEDEWSPRGTEAVFATDVAICQVAQVFCGLTVANDVVDMRNAVFYQGQALFRDRCDGMTSVGTGATYCVTTSKGLHEFLYGEVIIEDTSTSHEFFLQGKRAVYLPPLASAKRQYTLGIAKAKENYIEGLERWHLGAVQIWCTQALPRGWYWCCLGLQFGFGVAACVPTVAGPDELSDLFKPSKWIADNPHQALMCYSAIFYLLLPFVIVPLLSVCAPLRLNWCLRHWIIYENCTYPFWCWPSLFWLAVPPWICVNGKFPFPLNGIAAVVGSVALKLADYMIIWQMQRAGEARGVLTLGEASLHHGQQMFLVQIPIYARAVWRGLISGYNNAVLKKDNSFWESFTKSPTTFWCAMWVGAVVTMMVGSLAAGVAVLISTGVRHGRQGLAEVAIPEAYGMAMALMWIWVGREPLTHLLKDNVPGISTRHVDSLILLGMLVFTLACYPAATPNSEFNWQS